MATTIRPEISENNEYWINKHRYYELKHFCLQYPIWKKAYDNLTGLSERPNELNAFFKSNKHSDPTVKCAEMRMFYSERMEMIEQSAINADSDLASYILKGVTEGCSYDYLKTNLNIPCCKDTYYNRYRKFFYHLSNSRK